MMKRKNLNSSKKFWEKPVFLFFLFLAVLILISIPLERNLAQRYQINQQISDLNAQIVSLQGNNKDLDKLLSYLQSDQFAEAQARLNMGLKKPGEEVVIVNGSDNSVASDAAENFGQEGSNFWKWWNYFLGKK